MERRTKKGGNHKKVKEIDRKITGKRRLNTLQTPMPEMQRDVFY
jgi:hypothetical protein